MENRNIEEQGLDDWNPMVEDYKSKIFNSYREPSIEDLKKDFPGWVFQKLCSFWCSIFFGLTCKFFPVADGIFIE